MLKLNKKGFALVETLIVSVFVMTIFSLLFTNFFPMIGEYERREGYDDIDSIYKTYLIKTMLEMGELDSEEITGNYTNFIKETDEVNNHYFSHIYSATYDKTKDENGDIVGYAVMTNAGDCNKLLNSDKHQNYCVNLMKEARVYNIYLTKYRITDLKKEIKNGKISVKNQTENKKNTMDKATQDYILTLPYYSNEANNNSYSYRIIVEYVREINKESIKGRKEIYSFSTIGVNLV